MRQTNSAESNNSQSGGFVRQKKIYQKPQLIPFSSAEGCWEHYKDRGTPQELDRLRIMLNLPPEEEDEIVPRRRRA